jgi:hypothetical protein
MNTWKLYAMGYGAAGKIAAIQRYGFDPGITERSISADGSIDVTHKSIVSQSPIIRLSTTNIAQALTIMGVGGIAIDETGASNHVDLYYAKRAVLGGIEAGSVHIKATVNLGLMYPVSITAGHQADDPATLEYMIVVTHDGSVNDPMVFLASQAVPDLTPTVANVHTCGPWYVNGSLLDQIQSTKINFGLNPQLVSGSGQVWPRAAEIISRDASATCTTQDMAILATLGIDGVPRSSTTKCFLRKVEQNAKLIADNVEEHIKFEMAEGMIRLDDDVSVEQGQPASAGVRMSPTYNDSLDPIAYANNVVIS